MSKPTQEQVEQTAILNKLAEKLGRHVVPIFSISHRGRPDGCGTGLLVSRGQNVFLITAGHVIRDIEYNKNLFFYINQNTTRNLLASFRKTLSSNDEHSDDRLDIAVLKLDNFYALPRDHYVKFPLPINSLRSFAIPRINKHYLITGFPGSKSRYHVPTKLVRSVPYANYCISIGTSYESYGLREEFHIALGFDQKDVHAGDLGDVSNFPDPRGMSGSPIWLLFDENGNDSIEFSVVGILTEHSKRNRFLLATDIGVALDIIEREFS